MIEDKLSPLSDLLQERAASAWPEVRAFAEPPGRSGWSDARPARSHPDTADRSPTDVL